jgi:hypothetical protein
MIHRQPDIRSSLNMGLSGFNGIDALDQIVSRVAQGGFLYLFQVIPVDDMDRIAGENQNIPEPGEHDLKNIR